MTEPKRQILQGRIKLDGKTFTNVDFQKAELVYEGGAPPHVIDCTFSEATFAFTGAAGNTTNFLRAMLRPQSNMRQVVLGLMPEIQQN